MAIKLEMMRCFVTVARSGNLADAAQKLHRTPSAVSMMLKQFEDNLGGPLFESDRKSKLTALGQFVLHEASQEIDHFDQTVMTISNFANAKSGIIRIAAVPSVAGVILPKIIHSYLQDHPNVFVDLRDMDSTTVLAELAKERIDIGISSHGLTLPDIETRPLFSDAFGIVCPNDHPLTTATEPLTWASLKGLTFLANGLCNQISGDEFQEILAASKVMIHNTTSLLGMVREGVGVTVLPRLVVDLSASGLVFLPVEDPNARRNIALLKRSDGKISPAALKFEKAILNWCKAEMG